jgi:hypothetical protein
MRRHAPLIFALLSALFLLERGVNSGFFTSRPPVVAGLAPITSPGAGSECVQRDELLRTLAQTGARLSAEQPPLCTDRPDLAEWFLAEEPTGPRHLAFDAEGCLATWNETPCP